MSDATKQSLPSACPHGECPSRLSVITSLSALLLTLSTALGVCLYLTGHVANITLLRDLGVPSDLFPQGAEWTMINGYYAVFLEWVRTLADMPWGLLTWVGLLLAFAIWVFRLPAREKRYAWFDRLPKLARDLVSALLAAVATMALVFYLLLFVLLITVIPAYVGERAGHHAATEQLKVFQSSVSSSALAELWHSNELLMRGHVVAVSGQLVAFYDVKAQRVRIIDRAGTELRMQPKIGPNKTKPDSEE